MSDDLKDINEDLKQSVRDDEHTRRELEYLFGPQVVEQARQIDIADLNLNEEMTKCIATGVSDLKKFRSDPAAQIRLVHAMEPGARLLLCMWIMDMELLDRIQIRSYTS